jgi:hypothetical protein
MAQTGYGAERMKNTYQRTRIALRRQGIAQGLHIGFKLRPLVCRCGAGLAAAMAAKIKNYYFKISQQATPKHLVTIHRQTVAVA